MCDKNFLLFASFFFFFWKTQASFSVACKTCCYHTIRIYLGEWVNLDEVIFFDQIHPGLPNNRASVRLILHESENENRLRSIHKKSNNSTMVNMCRQKVRLLHKIRSHLYGMYVKNAVLAHLYSTLRGRDSDLSKRNETVLHCCTHCSKYCQCSSFANFLGGGQTSSSVY